MSEMGGIAERMVADAVSASGQCRYQLRPAVISEDLLLDNGEREIYDKASWSSPSASRWPRICANHRFDPDRLRSRAGR
jgi:hypothetical protein